MDRFLEWLSDAKTPGPRADSPRAACHLPSEAQKMGNSSFNIQLSNI